MAKDNSLNPKNGLTQDESASIDFYMLSRKAEVYFFHRSLNQDLRSNIEL